jgi:hypothetical protein
MYTKADFFIDARQNLTTFESILSVANAYDRTLAIVTVQKRNLSFEDNLRRLGNLKTLFALGRTFLSEELAFETGLISGQFDNGLRVISLVAYAEMDQTRDLLVDLKQAVIMHNLSGVLFKLPKCDQAYILSTDKFSPECLSLDTRRPRGSFSLEVVSQLMSSILGEKNRFQFHSDSAAKQFLDELEANNDFEPFTLDAFA